MGLLTKYSGLQKRKTMARSMAINRRNKYHKSLMPTDIILPTTSLTANTMKNEEVIPCFQDGRLVLFDPDKVLKAMESYNENSAKRKVKKK
jgi:hypothetical protein